MSEVVSTKPVPLPKGVSGPNIPAPPPKPKKVEPPPWTPQEAQLYYHDAQLNLSYAFFLLQHTTWWIAWRATVLGSYRIFYDPSPESPPAFVEMNPTTGKIDMAFNLTCAVGMSPGDIAYIFAHETLHFVFDHLGRMKRYQYIWNIATDAYINEYLDRNVNWSLAVQGEDRFDFILHNGIRWKSLPEGVRKMLPIEGINDYSADEIYDAILKDMRANGVDPDQFEGRVYKMGKKASGSKAPQTSGPGDQGKREIVRQRVPLEVGDVVYVKSKDRYGVVKNIVRNTTRVQLSDVDIDIDDKIPDKVLIDVALNNNGKFDATLARNLMGKATKP